MSALERLLAFHLAPLRPTQSGRNEWGVLWFEWQSKTDAVGPLFAYVSSRDVTLSCGPAHTHFDVNLGSYRALTNRVAKKSVAREAAKEVARFLRDEIAVVTDIEAGGASFSSAWCHVSKLDDLLGQVGSESNSERQCRAWSRSRRLRG